MMDQSFSPTNSQLERQKELEELRRKEAAAHQAVLLDIQHVLTTRSGFNFIKYLFKELAVGEIPEVGLPDTYLKEFLGHMRAGNAVFKIIAEANPQAAGQLIAQIEKEKYVQLSLEARQDS